MQILFLPIGWTVALCFGGWFLIQLAAAHVCLKLPKEVLSPHRFLFRERAWEQGGRIYKRLFRVNRWKQLLPDGAAVIRSGFRKKRLTDFSRENLDRFLVESCRAELTHLLAILPFWVFGFIGPPRVIVYMLLYALAVNLPCIIVQRYNRPRVCSLMEKIEFKGLIQASTGERISSRGNGDA